MSANEVLKEARQAFSLRVRAAFVAFVCKLLKQDDG